jgi:hypothetical protein
MGRRDQSQQRPVPVRKNLGETFRPGKPDLGIVSRRLDVAPRDRHGALLHVLDGGNAEFQFFDFVTARSRRTESTSVQKSASKIAASASPQFFF